MNSVIRDFGDWELVLIDLASCERAFINKVTKEISEDPPDDVLEILESENRQRRVKTYDPTSFHFASLSAGLESLTCSCCKGTCTIEGIGECPLCDGSGRVIEQAEAVDVAQIENFDLPGCNGAFLLRNFLSQQECNSIVRQAEVFGLRCCGYKPRIRVTDRVSILGHELADTLFERARPYLSDVEVWRCGGAKWPIGIRDDARVGVWVPVGLNPCFRVCRYKPGGFFLPHKDGGFEYNDEHLSLKTFMLYLNDEFEGAPTTFYKQSQKHYVEPDPSKVIYELHPHCRSCVVFNHWLVHDGGLLHSGIKYILRTEVMYSWRGRK
mmetsp:Transcript_122301/g.191832  ORF Transcript_122301/g.191832 Transcript_122301/m.191832 type:complete len:324 (-) Transcript_122301:104-1075(-)